MPTMSMLDYELMEGARHVQNSSSVMSVGSLAVPGKVGNGQQYDKQTIYKRKESVKNHGMQQYNSNSTLPCGIDINKANIPSSISEPVAAVTIVTMKNEKETPIVVAEKMKEKEDEKLEEVWPDTSLNVSLEEIKSCEVSPAPVTKRSFRISQSRSTSNIATASLDEILPMVERHQVATKTHHVQRALSGGNLQAITSSSPILTHMSSWQQKPNAKSHVAIPIPSENSEHHHSAIV